MLDGHGRVCTHSAPRKSRRAGRGCPKRGTPQLSGRSRPHWAVHGAAGPSRDRGTGGGSGGTGAAGGSRKRAARRVCCWRAQTKASGEGAAQQQHVCVPQALWPWEEVSSKQPSSICSLLVFNLSSGLSGSFTAAGVCPPGMAPCWASAAGVTWLGFARLRVWCSKVGAQPSCCSEVSRVL